MRNSWRKVTLHHVQNEGGHNYRPCYIYEEAFLFCSFFCANSTVLLCFHGVLPSVSTLEAHWPFCQDFIFIFLFYLSIGARNTENRHEVIVLENNYSPLKINFSRISRLNLCKFNLCSEPQRCKTSWRGSVNNLRAYGGFSRLKLHIPQRHWLSLSHSKILWIKDFPIYSQLKGMSKFSLVNYFFFSFVTVDWNQSNLT